MNHTLSRRRIVQVGLLSGLALPGRSARACEFFGATLRVTHPWTRATADDAQAAVVCMKFDQVTRDDRLIGVETPVAASAEMAGIGARRSVDFAILQGSETQLSESGTYLRLLGLRVPLEVGHAYPLLLHFEVGGPLRTDLTVDYARFR